MFHRQEPKSIVGAVQRLCLAFNARNAIADQVTLNDLGRCLPCDPGLLRNLSDEGNL
jgi:hypothetical protein